MAVKMKFEEFISDMKSITQMPMFTLSPAKRIDKEDGESKKDEKVKTKILEAWNNIRYDLGPVASLKKDIPIWILGVCHHSRSAIPDLPSKEVEGTDITTDTGWGCMLRTAQMMTAQGLMFHFLGRNWRWLTNNKTLHERNLHKEIIGWFIDDPGCPLSIHRLSQIGRKFGNTPGNWYGPNTVAHIMQHAIKESEEKFSKLREIAVYVAVDCTVYSDDVYDLCEWRNESGNDAPANASVEVPTTSQSFSACSSSKLASCTPVIASSDLASNASNLYKEDIKKDNEVSKDNSVLANAWRENVKLLSHAREDVRTQDRNDETSSTDDSPYSESWCEIPAIINSPSYENFKKYNEMKHKNKPKKSRLKSKKTKKNKVSLYEDKEEESSQLNGRIIMSHFRIGGTHSEQTQETPDFASESTSHEECRSFSSKIYGATNTDEIDEALPVGDDVSDSAKASFFVTAESPSPVLYRHANANLQTGNCTPICSSGSSASKQSFSNCCRDKSPDDEHYNFLSSYIEPVPQDQELIDTRIQKQSSYRSNSNVEKSKISKCYRGDRDDDFDSETEKGAFGLSKFTRFEVASGNVPEHRHSFGPVKSVHALDGSGIVDGGKMTRSKIENALDTSTTLPKHERHTQPIPIQHPNTRDRPRLLRRSSSTSGVRRRSTLGVSPLTPGERPGRNKSLPIKKSRRHKAVIILIPVRLGESALNPIYAPCVENMLSLESSIGIIGGKPKHSLYFVGCQGRNLLHLDPHYCQPADSLTGYGKNLHDYHTTQIRKINVKKIDPSCCLGFYCRSPEEFEDFKVQSQRNFTPPQQPVSYPMCLIMEGRSGDHKVETPIGSPDFVNAEPFSVAKNTALPMMEFFETDESHITSPPSEPEHSFKTRKAKKKTDTFTMEDVSATLNKLNPLSKFRRAKSPTGKCKNPARPEEISLESQFELL